MYIRCVKYMSALNTVSQKLKLLLCCYFVLKSRHNIVLMKKRFIVKLVYLLIRQQQKRASTEVEQVRLLSQNNCLRAKPTEPIH